MSGKISVITLVSGRESALCNLVKGLSVGTEQPDELIVVFMNEECYQLPIESFPIISVSLISNEIFPLSSARNLGAKSASFDKLIFLDVDCIPEKTLVQRYKNALGNDLYTGKVRYLSKKAMIVLDFEKLEQLSSPDPIRSTFKDLPYELFWSLNFACKRSTFEKIGGFNEAFKGYGAEDTDFAFRTRLERIPLQLIDATAYHEYHESYDPPLNHLNSIVDNASVFHEIWNRWPMEGWLTRFRDMGLIEWNQKIKIIRQPTPLEISNAKKKLRKKLNG